MKMKADPPQLVVRLETLRSNWYSILTLFNESLCYIEEKY